MKEQFDEYVRDWIEHLEKPSVKFAAFVGPMRDCDAYRGIVNMGAAVLSLVRTLYDEPIDGDHELESLQKHGLVGVVAEIVGDDFVIPKEIRGMVNKMQEYTISWLDENKYRYL
jgi:hypothetical protein